jgi:hypothetical protein
VRALLAAVQLFLFFMPMYGQENPFMCFQIGSPPPTLRSSGLSEKVGDVMLMCVGGDPTAAAAPVNIQVALNVNLTSRILNKDLIHPASEAILLVNEPGNFMFPGPVVVCAASQALTPAGCPPGVNVYQGVQTMSPNAVVFQGVQIAQPGTGPPMILRITNLRGNASQLPQSSFGIPPQVLAAVEVSDPVALPIINNQPVMVAMAQPGISWSLRTPDNLGSLTPGSLTFQQCTANNGALAQDASSGSAPQGVSFIVRVSEVLPTALLKQADSYDAPGSTDVRPAAHPQNIPGAFYNPSESGLFDPGYPLTDAMSSAGLSSQATRFVVRFSGPRGGMQIHAPAFERGRNSSNSRVRLVAAEPSGSPAMSLPYVPLGPASSALGSYYSPDMAYVYEITAQGEMDPNMMERIDLPFYVAYAGKSDVGIGTTNVSVNLSPISTVAEASALDWIPRFAELNEWQPLAVMNAAVNACQTQPKLTASLGQRAGPANARIWPVKLTNIGTGTAVNARISGFTLTQTFGAACTPVVQPSLPVSTGDLAPGGSAVSNMTIDFSSCPSLARFSATIQYAADGGLGGSSVYSNQFR